MKYTSFLKEKIDDLTGHIHLITGANTGLGYFTALQLAYRGATIILAVRDLESGQQALHKIQLEVPAVKGFVLTLDMASFESIQQFIQQLKQTVTHVDAVLFNAGVYSPELSATTKEGFPLTSGVNYFGVYYMLREATSWFDTNGKKPTRLVFVGSNAAHRSQFESVQDLINPKINLLTQYGFSKLAVSRLFHGLQMNLNLFDFPDRKNLSAILVNPGLSGTTLFRSLQPKWIRSLVQWVAKTFFPEPEQAALVLTFAMGHRYVVNGSYYGIQGLWNGFGKPSKIEIPSHFSKSSAKLLYDTGKLIQTKEVH